MIGKTAAFHAYCMYLLHILGDGHEHRDGTERYALVVGIEAGYYHTHSPVGKSLADLHEIVSEELGFIYAHHLHVRSDIQHFRSIGYRLGVYLVSIVRYDLDIGIALVYGRFEDGDLLVGELCTTQTTYQLFGLAGEH